MSTGASRASALEPSLARCSRALPQVRYDNAGIFGTLPDNNARQALLYTNGGQGEVVTVNITPDKKMSAPVRHLWILVFLLPSII